MLTLVILAAGAGSRYGGLKPLAPVGPSREALLEYSAFDAARAGFGRVVLVVRPRDEVVFRRHFDAGMAKRLDVGYVHQTLDDLPAGRVKPWGTGQAVLTAAAEIQGPFAVVNGDDFYGAGTYETLARFLQDSPSALAVVGFRADETLSDAGAVSRAHCRLDDQGFLREIVELQIWRQDGRIVGRDIDGGETTELQGHELVSMNGWGFALDLVPELRRRFTEFVAEEGEVDDAEFRLPDVVQVLIRDGGLKVRVVQGSGPWCGITFRQDEERAATIVSDLVAQGTYPDELWQS